MIPKDRLDFSAIEDRRRCGYPLTAPVRAVT